MEEIKYRAWDKNSGSWFYFTLDWFSDYKWIETVWKDVDIDWEKVCRFTGLLDKNGKEIYECDIVIAPDASDDYKVSEIVWSDGAWVLSSWNEKTLQRWVISQFEMEIIGNIHEAPELLTKNK